MDIASFLFFHLLYLKLPTCKHSHRAHQPGCHPQQSKQALLLQLPSCGLSLRTQKTLVLHFCRNVNGVVFFQGFGLVYFFVFLWEGFVLTGGEKSKGIPMWFEVSAFLASVDKQAFSLPVCAWLYVIFHTKSRFSRKESQGLIMLHFVNGKTFIKPKWRKKKTKTNQTPTPTS